MSPGTFFACVAGGLAFHLGKTGLWFEIVQSVILGAIIAYLMHRRNEP